MRKTTRIIALSLLAFAPFLSANADDLLLKGNDSNGVTNGSAVITTESVVVFTADGLEVRDGAGNAVATFPYSWLDNMTFSYDGSGVAPTFAANCVSLKNNPVSNLLEFTNSPESPARLAVTDMEGRVVIERKTWNGESVDVSLLPVGIYMVSFNNQTIKFIKK